MIDKKDPRRMFGTDDYWFGEKQGASLYCPVCKTEYVHLGEAEVHSKDYIGRNGALFIPMWCESGHSWDLIIDQHKGLAFMTVDHVTKTDQVKEEEWK